MSKLLATIATISLLAAGSAMAGDAAKGEKTFKKCKACHAITAPDGEKIVKGGRTGPNLYGVIGRQAGSEEGFKYGSSIVEAGEEGLIWTEEEVAAYVANPKGYLSDYMGHSAKSRMTFKLKKGGDDVAAYLASIAE